MKLKYFFSLLLAISISITAKAAQLADDPHHFAVAYDLKDFAGKMTFLEFMRTKVYPSLEEIRRQNPQSLNNDRAVDRGIGVAVKIADRNYTYHVNYKIHTEENSERSGRSYGLGPMGHLSDPSDKYYLDELEQLVHGDPQDLKNFYIALIKIIADCDGSGYAALSPQAQVVATDFMAIYIAEEDRHLMSNLGSFNWDDALFQVTMLAAMHGGQSQMSMIYQGRFTRLVYDQMLHVYKQPNLQNGQQQRNARLRDYWQFSANDPNRSGINLTRGDFESLGSAVTRLENAQNSARLAAVESDLGIHNDRNIFKNIATFFINRNAARNMHAISARVADDVANFLMEIHDQSNAMTTSFSTSLQ